MKPTEVETQVSSDEIVTHLIYSDDCGIACNITIDLKRFRYATVTARADMITQVLKAFSWPPKE